MSRPQSDTHLQTDLHTHTTYSDGYDMEAMVRAAEEAGLERIGVTDHCLPYEDPFGRSDRYDFDETYEERRADVETLRRDESIGVDVLDAVEINYDPNHEQAIREFLAEADFDYVIGSVHYAGEYYVAHPEHIADEPKETRRAAIENYVDWQVKLIESGLFDVLGHLDVVRRSPILREDMLEDDYRAIADALAASVTVPEINAGRLDREYGTIHPHPDHLDVFREAEVPFVFGTDAHAPDQLRERLRLLEPLIEDLGVELAKIG